MNKNKIKRNRKKGGKKASSQETRSELTLYGNKAKAIFAQDDSRSPISMTLPRGLICPDRMVTTLMYLDVSHTLMNAVGAHVASYRYRPTGAFDLDPTSSGTSMPGFAEWAAFYEYYRVLGYCLEFQVDNKETFPVEVITLPLNADPGASPSEATVQAWEMNPYVTAKNLSGLGGMDRTIIKKKVDCRSFIGSGIQRFDDSYASLVTTVPANNIYHPVAVYSMATVFVNGVYMNLRIAIEIEFFERSILTS